MRTGKLVRDLFQALVLVVIVSGGIGATGCGDDSTCETCNNTNCAEPQPPLGNIGLRDGKTDETASAGLPSEMRVTVFADAIKLNAYVRLSLIPENGTMADRIPVTGAVVDRLDPNEAQEIVRTFTLPADLPAGTYTGVFTVNEEDYYPEDDALQGEAPEDVGDNTVVADASMVVTVPDGPVIEVTSTQLAENSFYVNTDGPLSQRDATTLLGEPDLQLQQELVARVASISDPVELSFALQVGSDDATALVPIKVLEVVRTADSTEVHLRDRAVLAPTCRDAQGAPVDPGTSGATCASLHRDSPMGASYNLFVTDEAYGRLPAEEAGCTLVVTVDPDQKLTLASGSRESLTLELPVQFLPAATSVQPYAIGPENVVPPLNRSRTWGGDEVNAGYTFSAYMRYWKTNWDVDGVHFPVRGKFNASGALPITLFGYTFNLLDAGIRSDFDIDNITGSYFKYWLNVFGIKIFGHTKYLHGGDQSVDEQVLMDSKDAEGEERFAKSVSKDVSTTIMIAGVVPLMIEAGGTGTLGITGHAGIKAHNVLELGVGPFVELEGRAAVGLGTEGLNVKVGGSLLLIRLTQLIRPFLQFQPSLPRAQVGIAFPLIIDTLDGRIYLGYELGTLEGEYTLVSWNGLSYEINYVDPLRWFWGYGDQAMWEMTLWPPQSEGAFTVGHRYGPLSNHVSLLQPGDPSAQMLALRIGKDQVAFYNPATDQYVTYVPHSEGWLVSIEMQDAGPHSPNKWQRFTIGEDVLFRDTSSALWRVVNSLQTWDGRYLGCDNNNSNCEELDVVDTPPPGGATCVGPRCALRLFELKWGAEVGGTPAP